MPIDPAATFHKRKKEEEEEEEKRSVLPDTILNFFNEIPLGTSLGNSIGRTGLGNTRFGIVDVRASLVWRRWRFWESDFGVLVVVGGGIVGWDYY